MIKTARSAKILHLICELQAELSALPAQEFDQLSEEHLFRSSVANLVSRIGDSSVTRDEESRSSRSRSVPFSDFKLETVINALRSTVMNSPFTDGAEEAKWLLRILLVSPELFQSVREVDVFLSNMTGLMHDTKSTGRDRIVDWYMSEIEQLPPREQSRIVHRILRNIFVTYSSNFREWKAILERMKG